jgi:Uma2 family endonuclease
MTVQAPVSIGEYLTSVYDPDVDFVDGELEDRYVGEKDHAKLQVRVLQLFGKLNPKWFVTIETRMRVSDTRFRVPDVCVYEQEPDEQVFTSPPLAVVEVLSPDDRMTRMHRKLEDYYTMGCRNVWLLDPWGKKAFAYDGTAITEVHDELSVAGFDIKLSEVFPEK